MYVYIFRLSMESLPCRRFLIKGVTIFFRKCVDVVFAHKEYKSIISFVKKGVKCINKNNLMINKVVQQTIIFFSRRKYSWFSSWNLCNSCLKQNTFVDMICVKIEMIFEWLITRNSLEHKNSVKIASIICISLNMNLQNVSLKKIKHRLVLIRLCFSVK